MALLIGVVLALVIGIFGTAVGLDRDRAFYPTVMIVIALLYCLFAVIGGSTRVLLIEAVFAAGFITAAVIGFRGSLWIVAAALAAHGIFDFVRVGMIANGGVPPWWPPFCLTYDVVAAGYLGWRIKGGGVRVRGD